MVVLAMQSDEVRAPSKSRPHAGRNRSRLTNSVLGEQSSQTLCFVGLGALHVAQGTVEVQGERLSAPTTSRLAPMYRLFSPATHALLTLTPMARDRVEGPTAVPQMSEAAAAAASVVAELIEADAWDAVVVLTPLSPGQLFPAVFHSPPYAGIFNVDKRVRDLRA